MSTTVTGERLIAEHQAAGSFFTAAGIRSFVRAEGEGEPVVLMHGLPASSFLYRKVIPELAARGFRAHAFDWPGLGLAERPTDFSYSLRDLGAFCAAAVDELGLDRFHLVVHDAGGPLGFELALRTLPRIRSLTILNTMFELPRTPFPGELLGKLHPSGVGAPMRSLRVWRTMLERVGVWDKTVLTDEVVAAWRDLALGDNDGASYLAIMRNVRDGHETGAWASVVDSRTAAYPIRIAWGGHDPMLSLRKFGWKMLDGIRAAIDDDRAGQALPPGGQRCGGGHGHRGERRHGAVGGRPEGRRQVTSRRQADGAGGASLRCGRSRQPTVRDRRQERRMVPLVLVRVGDREVGHGVREGGVLAQIGGDRDRVARSGVAARQRPAAELAPLPQVLERHRLDDRARLLVLELAHVEVPSLPSRRPAQQHVARRLEPALAGHHALAVVGVDARRQVTLEHGRLRLLELEEQRIAAVAGVQQHDDRHQPDAAHAHDLERGIHEAEALQQLLPVLLDRGEVAAPSPLPPIAGLRSGWWNVVGG